MVLNTVGAAIIVFGFMSATAVAQTAAPTGFAEIPWGTPSFKVSDAMSGRCTFVRISAELAICSNYEIPTLGSVKVFFTSTESPAAVSPADGVLDGYRLEVGWRSYRALRQLAYEKFGTTPERGRAEGREIVVWRWPRVGPLRVEAVLFEDCEDGRSCLSVNTARRAGLDAEALKQLKEKARKSF